jgi:hypothetical protein
MITITILILRCRLPLRGGQRCEVVLIGHRREPAEDVTQIRERIFAVALA